VAASFGLLMLSVATVVEDRSDSDSATEEASTRQGLIVVGVVLVAAGLWGMWITTRDERSRPHDRPTPGGPPG
jgi:hypothetical protein